ncbi:hypothetical protein NPIL_622901 [Nephila pilipes]|uniref:Uncharacterized protein n=1 Tax=Nephila pilipes TaxID=299642 RepID=A0A8X6MX01_NEPPI|nr:hypothetical protein NPIL_622901 [Nephila pilipes]
MWFVPVGHTNAFGLQAIRTAFIQLTLSLELIIAAQNRMKTWKNDNVTGVVEKSGGKPITRSRISGHFNGLWLINGLVSGRAELLKPRSYRVSRQMKSAFILMRLQIGSVGVVNRLWQSSKERQR